MTSPLIVSLHDVAPASMAESERWIRIVERHGLVASLLVIPGPWRGGSTASDPAFADWLHAAEQRGHEIALHGWNHSGASDPDAPGGWYERTRSRIRARGCAEFASLGPAEARRRVQAGQDVLRGLGFDPIGFVPPGWLARTSSAPVLAELGFRYTVTQWRVTDLEAGRTIVAPSTSQRPGSRLAGTAARLNVEWSRRWIVSGRPLRVALHPDDLSDERLVESTELTLCAAATAGYAGTTYRDFVAQLHGERTRSAA